MTTIRKFWNKNLETEIAASGVVMASGIQILELEEETLKAMGWMDDTGWPSGDFLQVLSDLETVSPSEFQNGARFWDQIQQGFSVYNQFLEDGEND